MSGQYYLVAQLPAFSVADTDKKLPVTVQRFKDLCSRFMDGKNLKIISELSLVPPLEEIPTGSSFVDSWNKEERTLRIALAKVRTQHLNKDAVFSSVSIPADILQTAKTAIGMDNPYQAELFLNKYRLNVIDTLAPLDAFSDDAVFAYGLRLMLTERIQKFDEERGMASYHKIYDRILGENA